jgi:ribosomal protein S18 acetylase RimI-like enzyme
MNQAQELYRRHGFVETGRDENYVDMERGATPDATPHSTDTEPRVREARSDEAGLLLDILLRAYREYEGRLDPPSGVHLETMASIGDKLKEGGALVCEVGGTVAGCVFYAPKAEYLYVGRLAVLPEYRRRGIGDLLLRASERRAGELGFTRVRLGVRLALAGLRAYYEARGYVPIAFRSHAGYTEATYVEMEKALEDRAPK